MLGDMKDRKVWKPWLKNYVPTQRSFHPSERIPDRNSSNLVLFVRIIYEDKCEVYTLRDLRDGVQIYQIKAELELLSGIPTKMMEMHFPPDRNFDDEDAVVKGKNVSFGETARVHLNESWNAFLHATWKGTLTEVKRFISIIHKHIGSSIVFPSEHAGETQIKDHDNLLGTALYIASRRGDEKICKILIRNGASATFTTSLGNSCLHTASSAGHLTVIQLLVSHGANVRCHNIHNTTPMETAINRGYLNCARWLWLNQWSLTITKDLPTPIGTPRPKTESQSHKSLLSAIPVPESPEIPDVRFRSKTPNFNERREKRVKSKSRPQTAMHAADYGSKIDQAIDDALRKNRYSRGHQRDAIHVPNIARANSVFSSGLQSEKTKQIINFFNSRRNRLQSIPSKFNALPIPANNLQGVSLTRKSISRKEKNSPPDRRTLNKSASSRSSGRDSGISSHHDEADDCIDTSEEVTSYSSKTYQMQAENYNRHHQIPKQEISFKKPSHIPTKLGFASEKTSSNRPTYYEHTVETGVSRQARLIPIFVQNNQDHEHRVTELPALQNNTTIPMSSQRNEYTENMLETESERVYAPPSTPEDDLSKHEDSTQITAAMEPSFHTKDTFRTVNLNNEALKITTRIPDENYIPEEEYQNSEPKTSHMVYEIEQNSTAAIETVHDIGEIKTRESQRLSVRFESTHDTTIYTQKHDTTKTFKKSNRSPKTSPQNSPKLEPKQRVSETEKTAENDEVREDKNRKAFEVWLSKKRKSIIKQKEEEAEIRARAEKQKLSHRTSLSMTFDEWVRLKEEREEVHTPSEEHVAYQNTRRRDSKYQKTYDEWKKAKEKQEKNEMGRRQSEESEKKLKEYYEAETRKKEYNRKMEAWLKKKEQMRENELKRKKRIEQMYLETANLMYREWLSKPRVKTFDDWKKDKEHESRLNVVSKAQQEMTNEHQKEMEDIRQQIAKEKFEQWLFKKELSKWKTSELELEKIKNRRKKRQSLTMNLINEGLDEGE